MSTDLTQLFISHAGANLNTSSFLLCRRDLDCHLLVILEHAPHLAAKTTKLLCRGACLCCHLLAHNYKFRINKSKNSVTPCQNDDKIVIKDIFPTATHKKITVPLCLVPAEVQSFNIYVCHQTRLFLIICSPV